MKAVLEAVRDFYQLPALEYSAGIDTGVSGTNHILTDGTKRYVLKRYYQREEARIEEIHRIMRYFSERDIPVPLAIKGKTGTVLNLEDGSYSLFPFVEGRHPKEGNLSTDELTVLGSMLARIHRAGTDPAIQVELTKSWPNQEKALDKIGKVRRIIGRLPARSDFDELALKVLDLKEQVVRSADINTESSDLGPLHLVHGDYHPTNILINDLGEPVAVLDWEHSKMSPRAIEIVRTAFISCMDLKDEVKQLRDMSVLFRSYNEIYPLNQDELRAAFMFFHIDDAHHFWVEVEHYQNDNQRPDVYLQKDYDFHEWYARWGAAFIDQLVDSLR